MQAPKRGRVFATNDGRQWCVSEVTTAADLDDPEIDPEFFLVTLVEGTDPDALDRDGPEFDPDAYQAWCDEHQISL